MEDEEAVDCRDKVAEQYFISAEIKVWVQKSDQVDRQTVLNNVYVPSRESY